MSDRFGNPAQTLGVADLSTSFIFVPHGDPEPLAWMAAHPGWVKFPATLVPRDAIGAGEPVAADASGSHAPVEQKSQAVPPGPDEMSTAGPRQGTTCLADSIRSYNDMSLLIGAPLLTPPTTSDPALSWRDAAHALSTLFGIPAAQAQTEEEATRRGETGPGSLEPAEASRLQRFNSSIETLKRLEPDNREITYLSTPEFIPDEATVERVEAEVREAKARRADSLNVAPRLPLGFGNQAAMRQFIGELRKELTGSGIPDPLIGLRGSSVTGFRYQTGEPFDNDSDLDVFIVSPRLMQRAHAERLPLRAGGDRTGPMTDPMELARVGLSPDFIETLSKAAGGRKVSIMIYNSLEAVDQRGSSYIILEGER